MKEKRNEIDSVDRALGLMTGDLDRADLSAKSSELELGEVGSALAAARFNEAKHETWLRSIANSVEFKQLEDGETKGWPSAASQEEATVMENRLEYPQGRAS